MEDVKMRSEEPTLNEALCQGRDEFFFRHSDVIRFHRAFETLVSDANHLLITSAFEGVIEHYAKMMLNRCAMRSGLVVETLMPSSTEALGDRFNEFVSKVSLDDARKSERSEAGRVIVINDVRFIEAESWPLLVRMTNDFPGLNIRLLILLDNLSASSERVLDRIGSKLIRWNIEAPSADEQTVLRAAAMKAGLDFQVDRVLNRINSKMSGALEPDLNSVTDSKFGTTGNALGEREAEDMRALFDADRNAPRKLRAITFGLATVIIAAFGAYAYRDHPIATEILGNYSILLGMSSVDGNPENTKESVVEAAYSNSTVVAEQTTDLVPLAEGFASINNMPENNVNTDNAIQSSLEVLSQDEVVDGTYSGILDIAANSIDQTAYFSDEISGQVSATATEIEDISDLPQTEIPRESGGSNMLQANIQIIQTSVPSSQFIQHLVSAEEASAREWLDTQSGLTKSMIVPVDLGEQLKFAVVSGPFEDQADIEKYIQAMPADADYWVRSGESLARVLDTD